MNPGVNTSEHPSAMSASSQSQLQSQIVDNQVPPMSLKLPTQLTLLLKKYVCAILCSFLSMFCCIFSWISSSWWPIIEEILSWNPRKNLLEQTAPKHQCFAGEAWFMVSLAWGAWRRRPSLYPGNSRLSGTSNSHVWLAALSIRSLLWTGEVCTAAETMTLDNWVMTSLAKSQVRPHVVSATC